MLRLEPNVFGSRIVPSPFVSLKVTTGFLPGAAWSTEVISAFRPLSCFDLSCTVYAPMTEASHSASPCGRWQEANVTSDCGPAGWPTPVVKFTSSWHEPHAFELG